VVGSGSGLQVGEKVTTDGAPRSHESRTVAPVRSPFVTRLLPDPAATAARPSVLAGGKDRLLSVRAAAEQLGLCTATVYGLCAEGTLPHVRILNAIRIVPEDLAAFVNARRVVRLRGDRKVRCPPRWPRS
jgi:excisionase family DNA binding protein